MLDTIIILLVFGALMYFMHGRGGGGCCGGGHSHGGHGDHAGHEGPERKPAGKAVSDPKGEETPAAAPVDKPEVPAADDKK